MDPWFIFLAVLVSALCIVLANVIGFLGRAYVNLPNVPKAQALVNRWAVSNGLTLQRVDKRWVRTGPFAGKAQCDHVFRISAVDSSGTVREGWAFCDGGWLDLSIENLEVRWDQPVAMAAVRQMAG